MLVIAASIHRGRQAVRLARDENITRPSPRLTTVIGDCVRIALIILERGVAVREYDVAMARFLGKVAWFNNAKGFGFLSRDGEKDAFVHYSAIQMEGYHTLTEGQGVEFEIIQGPKGPPADKVTILPTKIG